MVSDQPHVRGFVTRRLRRPGRGQHDEKQRRQQTNGGHTASRWAAFGGRDCDRDDV